MYRLQKKGEKDEQKDRRWWDGGREEGREQEGERERCRWSDHFGRTKSATADIKRWEVAQNLFRSFLLYFFNSVRFCWTHASHRFCFICTNLCLLLLNDTRSPAKPVLMTQFRQVRSPDQTGVPLVLEMLNCSSQVPPELTDDRTESHLIASRVLCPALVP